MGRREIAEKVISRVNFVGMCNADLSSHLKNDLGMDSLDMIELGIQLNKSLHINIDEDTLLNLNNCTVSDVVDYLEKHL